jgi:hypothetical protein
VLSQLLGFNFYLFFFFFFCGLKKKTWHPNPNN